MSRLDVGGRNVNVREHGDGPAVILLHSASSHSGQWKWLVERLGDAFHVLAPDLHGYGGSGPFPDDDQPYFRHDGMIVTTLLDNVDGPVHLVGHSLGGTIALRSALEHADRLASVTLIEPVLFNLLEEIEDPTAQEHLLLARTMRALVRNGEREGAARVFVEAWGAPGGFDAMDARTRAYVMRTIDRATGDWSAMSRRAPGALTATDLGALAAPTLLLCGQNTRPSMHRIAALLRAAIPAIEYQEIAGAGHMSPVTHHASVNEVIVAFLRRQAHCYGKPAPTVRPT